jgi:hypothetical protein
MKPKRTKETFSVLLSVLNLFLLQSGERWGIAVTGLHFYSLDSSMPPNHPLSGGFDTSVETSKDLVVGIIQRSSLAISLF